MLMLHFEGCWGTSERMSLKGRVSPSPCRTDAIGLDGSIASEVVRGRLAYALSQLAAAV